MKGRDPLRFAARELLDYNWKPGIVMLCTGLYFGSLVSPCLMQSDGSGYYGCSLLFFGWLPLIFGELCALPWLANPLLLLTLVAWVFESRPLALVSSVLCALCALGTFLLDGVWFSEAGASPVGYYGYGFYLWQASCCLPAASMLLVTLPTWLSARHESLG